MKPSRILLLTLLLLLGKGTLVAESLPQTNLPQWKLALGKMTIEVPVATTPEQRAIGLMYRTSLGPNEGMLFVFEAPQQVAFWMKNTPVPLSVAYLNSSGRILEIYDLTPLNENLVPSVFSSILYALEMPKGWFTGNGIQPGMKINGLPQQITHLFR